MNKYELRKKAKDILKAMKNEYMISSGKKISEKVIHTTEFKNSKTVFIYISTETEPDTNDIIYEALRLGKTVCVPKCISKNEMLAIKIDGIESLKEDRFGIKEPADIENQIDKSSIDLAVIPCVAASRINERLGHGAGYYDRFLADTTAYKMCLCFGKVVFDSVPTDQFDIIMDKIVTEV